MKHLNLFAICVGMLLAATQGNAQVSNNNEDGVYKMSDQLSRPTRFVSGQVIVKFKDATPVTVYLLPLRISQPQQCQYRTSEVWCREDGKTVSYCCP